MHYQHMHGTCMIARHVHEEYCFLSYENKLMHNTMPLCIAIFSKYQKFWRKIVNIFSKYQNFEEKLKMV